MDQVDNYEFKTLSLNVRGLNNQKKRRSVFRWVKKMKMDICFFQETYCTSQVQNIWTNEWGGKILFSNGTNHSRGVAILIRPGLDIEIIDTHKDEIGRVLLLKVKIQNTLFNLLNVYAPNNEGNQVHF